MNDNIWIHKSAKISDSASINGPAIIDEGSEIRHCAFIRGNVIIGKNCVLGNSCEIKDSILVDEAKAPHFNYVGNSIMGYKSHLGAGVILSNLRSDGKNVIIDKKYDTKQRKVGSFLADNVEIGCNSVLNPGTIILHDSSVYPLTSVRGIIKENSIVKSMENIVNKD